MTTARIGLLPALLIAAAVAFAGWSVGQGVVRFRMADRSVTVKGLAERGVPSDFAVCTLGFRRAGNDFASVQQGLHGGYYLLVHSGGMVAHERPVHIPDHALDPLVAEKLRVEGGHTVEAVRWPHPPQDARQPRQVRPQRGVPSRRFGHAVR